MSHLQQGGGNSLRAQTNYVAGWDGGNDTSSPSNFGWSTTSSANLNGRNASGGARMTTTYSNYKLEDNTSYSYSASSDPSSVIFWVRYNATSGKTYTYTFKGLEADHYYDFSGLVGWHNNNSNPTFTVTLKEGTHTLAEMSKKVTKKQTLYSVGSKFKASSTITTNTEIQIVFTADYTKGNDSGYDCMEAISALKLVEDFEAYRTELSSLITYATNLNGQLNSNSLETAISTAQSVVNNTESNTTFDDIAGLKSAISSALASASLQDGDVTFLVWNPGFEEYQTQYIKTNGGDSYYVGGWTNESPFVGSSYSYSIKDNDKKSEGESSYKIRFNWSNTTYSLSQELPSLPAGRYTLTADVRAYSDNNSTEYAYIQGNDTKCENIKVSTSEFNTVSTVVELNEAGPLNIILGMDYKFDTRSNTNQSAEGVYFWDNVTLSYLSPVSAAKADLLGIIENAEALYNNGTNVGADAFQIPTAKGTIFNSSISTAQEVYDNTSATVSEVNQAIEDLNGAIETYNAAELNQPVEDKRYTLTFHSSGHNNDGYVLTAIHNARSNQGLYGFKYYTSSVNDNYAQAFKFTWVSGNQYKISFIGTDGVERYLTTATKGYGESNNHRAIRTTTEEGDALPVEIKVTTTSGQYELLNTLQNSAIIAHNGSSNNDMYTNNSATFSFDEASQASVTVKIGAGKKWGTCIFPFVPAAEDLPADVSFYTAVVSNDAIDLTEVDNPVANVPYILKNNDSSLEAVNTTLQGYGTAKQDDYTEGALTGILTQQAIPANSYVLQTQGGVQGFYQLEAELPAASSIAYRAYLTNSNSGAALRAIFFNEEETTGVATPEVKAVEDGTVYNMAGQRVNKDYKGIVIKNGKKILVK